MLHAERQKQIEQIRLEDGTPKLAWVNDERVIQYDDPGIAKCMKCGAVDTYSLKELRLSVCKSCGRITKLKQISPPEIEEPWLPYPEPEPLPRDLSVENIGNEISDILSKTLVLRNPQEYEILTSWIIASYRQQDWKSAPYLQFIAPVSSGKTRALEIVSLLSYRGVLYATISPAALCREIEKYKITPFIDQAEYNFDTRAEPGRENYSIWTSGYRKGQKYTKAKQDNDEDVIRRDVFRFKALASTRVFDSAIASRSITFYMRESTPKIRDIDDNLLERIQKVRSKLIYLHLLPEFPFIPPRAIREIDKLDNGRLIEIYSPLISVSVSLGWGSLDVIDFAEKDSVKKKKEMQQTTEGLIVRVIKEMIDAGTDGKTNLDGEMTGISIRTLSEKTSIDTRVIGHRLRALDIERKHDRDGAFIDLTDEETQEQLQYLFRKYGYAQYNPTTKEWF